MMRGPIRLLTIGHSYAIARNRDIMRAVARDPDFQVVVVAPRAFRGDLRRLACDQEPAGSPIEVMAVTARATSIVHLFWYDTAGLRRVIGRGRFDVVHAWEEPYVYAGYQIGRVAAAAGARFSFRTAQSISKRYPRPFSWFERATLARAHGWIAGGSLVYDTMIARGYPPGRGRVLPLAVDPVLFHPLDEGGRAAVRHELGLTAPVVGFAGRLVQSKGLDVLMQCWDRLPAGQAGSLLLLGSGPYRETIEAWARRDGRNVPVRIVLATHDDVPRYLGAMDTLLVPSQTTPAWREQFGRVVIEAMACGVPVLGSDSGEIPRVMGDAGRVLPEADSRAWAAALSEVLASDGIRARMVKLGLRRAADFSVETVAQQYRDFYRSVAAQPLLVPSR